MRVLIAPDKFKGSLSASEAAEAITRGFRQSWPEAEIQRKPISDGGEGFVNTLTKRLVTEHVHDALGRIVDATYGWVGDSTAVIEMSAASGLWRIAPRERAPLRASTFGTGELIASAISHGAEKILVGLGGSATNDGGAGMAAALGYEFVTSDGEPLEPIPANLLALYRIKAPVVPAIESVAIIAACDVTNPLLGPRGASRVYGPQKGANARAVETLELALEQLADIVMQDLECDFRNAPGAGAAGGLGFGLMSFCNATVRPGFDLVAEVQRLDDAIAASDLVITGEGRLDAQTLEGKGPTGVAALAHKHGKPVIALCGSVDPDAALGDFFDAVAALRPEDSPIPLEQIIREGEPRLEALAASVAQQIRAGKLLSPFLKSSS